MKQREKPNLPKSSSEKCLRISGTSLNNVPEWVVERTQNTGKMFKSALNLPLFPSVSKPVKVNRRSHTIFSETSRSKNNKDIVDMTPCGSIILQTTVDGKIQASRTYNEREHNPDRLSLDRRGLTVLPILVNESKLRLLSLQHNLLTNLEKMALLCLPQLVFLDIYNNQLEYISALDCLNNLRVLLLGKNRIRRIEGLNNLSRLEVLDLHGNQITEVSGLGGNAELKVLNLAGNEIKTIGLKDLEGLTSLQELNLRRNRLKLLAGFGETPQLTKLFLSNNEIGRMEDIDSLTKLHHLKEVNLDGNPITMMQECVLFIASYLPSVQIFGQSDITDETRKLAHIWRMKREFSDKTTPSRLSSGVVLKKKSNIARTRSASENRFSNTTSTKQSRQFEQTRKSDSMSSIDREPHRARAAHTKSDYLPSRMKRLSYSKQRTVSSESANGSETSADFFRLPPILSPLLNSLDDCNVVIRNDTNTSLESNKSSRSVHTGSMMSTDKLPQSSSDSSSSSDESNNSISSANGKTNKPNANSVISQSTLPNKTGISRKASAEKLCSIKTRSDVPVKPKVVVVAKIVKQQKQIVARHEKVQEQGGDYLVEIAGRYFNVTGRNSAKFIDRAWNVAKANDVTTVRFNCVTLDSLVPVFNKIKVRFPNAEHFIFTDTSISCLGQLNALADIQGLTSLHILSDGNTITEKQWQMYAIYRLYHWGLRYIDNIPISEEQVKLASEEYKGLNDMVLWSLPDAILTPLLRRLHLEINSNISVKQWLYNADPELRNVICKEALQWRSPSLLPLVESTQRDKGIQNLYRVIKTSCSVVTKMHLLEQNWKCILQQCVKDTLADYSDMKSYTKIKMANL